jgi:hypothetical protein
MNDFTRGRQPGYLKGVIIARVLAAAATAAGVVAWILFLRADLVLSHYDARAHLVVARRIIDNITPGWQQVGAVWLPLPHLINAIPAQIDVLYRTGAFASLVSIGCFGLTAYAAARLVMTATGSPLGALAATALMALNPNLLYLQATPMTEPMLLGALFLAVLWLYEWVPLNQDAVPGRVALALIAAMLTRYEAWPVVAAAIVAAGYASARLGASPAVAVRRSLRLAAWPAAAVALVLINSRITVGSWFVSSGFFEPDPGYQGKALRSLIAVWWGTHQLSTRLTEIVGVAAAGFFVLRSTMRRADAALVIPAALFAAGVLPALAFYQGHPFRIRYMVPLVAACALFCGLMVGVLRQYPAIVLAGVLVGITLIQSPPWRRDAPMLIEAQWDRTASEGRRVVTACLVQRYTDGKILASMGSLAHYMQDLSREGFAVADFIHEGNGAIWELALETGPAPHAGWMLVEEQSEGGDVLAEQIRRNPSFANRMERVCEGGGVALYERR